MIHTVSTNMQCNPISSAGTNLVSCDKIFILPGGTTIYIYNCGDTYCTGDTILYLYSESGALLKSDNDGCGEYGSCSKMNYTIPLSTPSQAYTLKMNCYDASPCTGNIQIRIQCNNNEFLLILYIFICFYFCFNLFYFSAKMKIKSIIT